MTDETQPVLTSEQIKAIYQQFGTGRLDGFTAAIHAALAALAAQNQQEPVAIVEFAKAGPKCLPSLLWMVDLPCMAAKVKAGDRLYTSPPVAAVAAHPVERVEIGSVLQRLMARLADLLDDDKFDECNAIVRGSGYLLSETFSTEFIRLREDGEVELVHKAWSDWPDWAESLRAKLCDGVGAERPSDDVLAALDLCPDTFHTEGGSINKGKLRAALLSPAEYLPDGHWLRAAQSKQEPVAWRAFLEGQFFHGASRQGLIDALQTRLVRTPLFIEPLYTSPSAAAPEAPAAAFETAKEAREDRIHAEKYFLQAERLLTATEADLLRRVAELETVNEVHRLELVVLRGRVRSQRDELASVKQHEGRNDNSGLPNPRPAPPMPPISPSRPEPATVVVSEVERLRAEQAAAVMPLIGELLDAWDGLYPDVRVDIRHEASDLVLAICRIRAAMGD